jgi:hypothetical protein
VRRPAKLQENHPPTRPHNPPHFCEEPEQISDVAAAEANRCSIEGAIAVWQVQGIATLKRDPAQQAAGGQLTAGDLQHAGAKVERCHMAVWAHGPS